VGLVGGHIGAVDGTQIDGAQINDDGICHGHGSTG
jgi:hypothetical protein